MPQGALAVSSFRALDTDGDGLIDAENMVSAFARVNGITYAEAVEMTKLIMHKGDRGGGKSDGTLSFTEFVSVIAQDMSACAQPDAAPCRGVPKQHRAHTAHAHTATCSHCNVLTRHVLTRF
jgi:hypothetical protein